MKVLAPVASFIGTALALHMLGQGGTVMDIVTTTKLKCAA